MRNISGITIAKGNKNLRTMNSIPLMNSCHHGQWYCTWTIRFGCPTEVHEVAHEKWTLTQYCTQGHSDTYLYHISSLILNMYNLIDTSVLAQLIAALQHRSRSHDHLNRPHQFVSEHERKKKHHDSKTMATVVMTSSFIVATFVQLQHHRCEPVR
jgi:hypothetical protein